MMGRLFDDHDRFFDHDVQTCAVCLPKNDYWLDMPCPGCGHAFDEGTSTYVDIPDRANYITDWVLCHRCRLAVVVYGGFSVFTYDETGPGGDLYGYRCEGESGPDDAQRASTRKAGSEMAGRDPPMEPLPGSTLSLSSDTATIQADPDTATLVIRLELAIMLMEQPRAGDFSTPKNPPTAVDVRDRVLSLLTTASYVKEAMNILTGTNKSPGEFQRVSEWAEKGGAPASLTMKIGKICSGSHAATKTVNRLRNKLGFHWEPAALTSSLLEFVPNGTVVWLEWTGETTKTMVYRLAIDVLSHAMFQLDPSAAPRDPEERERWLWQRVTSAIEAVGDASAAIIQYFNFAVRDYLDSIGATL
jgi:hypothetical protein